MQYVIMKGSLKKLGETFGLQQEILKKELDQEDIHEVTWKDLRDN